MVRRSHEVEANKSGIRGGLTCNQFPTMGKATGPGGRFSLGDLLHLTTMTVNATTSRPCGKTARQKSKSNFLDMKSTSTTTPNTNIANKPPTSIDFSIIIHQPCSSSLKLLMSAQLRNQNRPTQKNHIGLHCSWKDMCGDLCWLSCAEEGRNRMQQGYRNAKMAAVYGIAYQERTGASHSHH